MALHVQQTAAHAEPYVFANLTGSLKEAVLQQSQLADQRQAQVVRERFEDICKSRGVELVERPPMNSSAVTASFQIDEGRTSHVLVERARLADVTALAAPAQLVDAVRQTPIGENLESVLLGSGRPVLIVPPDWQARRCEHAVIGWNETVQASRALAMTIPWLGMMETVTLVVSRERSRRVSGVQDYLAAHGIDTRVSILNRGEQSAGEALLARCNEAGADFLVVGGYSRARARQLLFGGVTRHLLRHTGIITVMVH